MLDRDGKHQPFWVYPLKMAEQMTLRGKYAAALELLDILEADLPTESAGLKWLEIRRDIVKQRMAQFKQRRAETFSPIALENIEHVAACGYSELALDLLELLESDLSPQSGGIKWIKLLRARLLVQLKGAYSCMAEVEEALMNDLNNHVTDDLRLAYIEHYPKHWDKAALRNHLDVLLRPNSPTSVFGRAYKVAVDQGIFNHCHHIFDSIDVEPIRIVKSGYTRSDFGTNQHYPTSLKLLAQRQREIKSAKVFDITNCIVISLGYRDYFFDCDDNLFTECSDPALPPVEHHLKDALARVRRDKKVQGLSVYINDAHAAHGSNYCHWLLDYLPRLPLLEDECANVDNIVCRPLEVDYEKRSLHFVGYGGTSLIEHQVGVARCFERLRVTDRLSRNFTHPILNGNKDLVCWWRSKFSASQNPTRRIYIARRGKRSILNETELVPLLLEYGFETVRPETMSFPEQVALFSEAELVVGGHGAGLTNILFAPKKCKVLEFFPNMGGSASFYCLAKTIGQDYSCAVANGPKPMAGQREPNHLSYSVPLEDVRQWLAASI